MDTKAAGLALLSLSFYTVFKNNQEKESVMTKINPLSKVVFFTAVCILAVLFTMLLLQKPVYAADEEYLPAAVSYEGKTVSQEGYIFRGTPYIPMTLLAKYGSTASLSIDKEAKRVNITLKSLNIYVGDGVVTEFIKKYADTVFIPLKDIDGTLYAPLNTLCQFVKLGYSVEDDTIYLAAVSNTTPMGRIILDGVSAAASLAEGSGKNILLPKGEVVFIREETSSYYKVETLSGEVAYIMKGHIDVARPGDALLDYQYNAKEKINFSGEKINLVWHYAGTTTPRAPVGNKGIDILAPTWFDQIVEGDGNVDNSADLGYTTMAHDSGLYVWATITNNMSTAGSTNYTTKVLADTTLRNKTIAQYLFYSCLYDVDGINIDYETVKDSDRDNLTAFVREMRKHTERLGLTLSIDTLIPKPWTLEYDYAALGRLVDYLAVMTYDEHYAGSPSAGSVASLPWVVESVEQLLTYMDSDKILMGIPLYARLWTVNSSGKPVSNKALTMTAAREIIQNKGLTPTWLSLTGQYYAEYPNGANTDKIWLEDARSIAGRISLIYTYDLAGSACWQYSQGDESAWDVFEAIYKKGASPGSFKGAY
jgi:spore germination protein YaaH